MLARRFVGTMERCLLAAASEPQKGDSSVLIQPRFSGPLGAIGGTRRNLRSLCNLPIFHLWDLGLFPKISGQSLMLVTGKPRKTFWSHLAKARSVEG